MSMSGSPNRRRELDIMKLMMSNYEVTMGTDCMNEFIVKFRGPKESPYEGGTWRVRVELPSTYPYKSPSIGFLNRIYHPNVDEHSGSVCLDVINQTWSPMFDYVRRFAAEAPAEEEKSNEDMSDLSDFENDAMDEGDEEEFFK